MIHGFLRAEGTDIVDGDGRRILLSGWGLGNWLLQEGYMWLSGSPRFDRPRRIEQVIEELAGAEYAAWFWEEYRENYVRREDILRMAELGYNSVRIPFCYRIFMEDNEAETSSEIQWKEEGFRLLDQCLDWCEEAGIYAFLDLHGAPGGQTGANIDDSEDDVPRLFLDEKNQTRCIALWERLAERYRDREVVGGYDFLNEPIAPPHGDGADFDFLIPKLAAFYERLTAAVRRIDTNHLLSIEGAHWATDLSIFDRKYDDNMVLHFHRYAEIPEIACLQAYLDKGAELNIPIWLGETGENLNEWYAAFYPLALSLGIGYNLWPWKKMECRNSPYSIRKPEGYDAILRYTEGGSRPDRETVQQILNQYLENIRLANCKENPEVSCHVLRRAPFSLRATDFDQRGKHDADAVCSGTAAENPEISYRRGCGMRLVELHPAREQRFGFDCRWDRFGLVLGAGEFACYQYESDESAEITITLAPGYPGGTMRICWMDEREECMEYAGSVRESLAQEQTVNCDTRSVRVRLEGPGSRLRVEVTQGELCMERVEFHG